MPGLDAVAQRRLARALVFLEGVIAECEAHATEDDEPKLELLKHVRDDIRIVLDRTPRAVYRGVDLRATRGPRPGESVGPLGSAATVSSAAVKSADALHAMHI